MHAIVIATEDGSPGTTSNEASATTPAPPVAPTGVTATPTKWGIEIAWSAVADATSYNLAWGNSTGSHPNSVTGVTSPYLLEDAPMDVPRFIVVTAHNAAGASPDSAEASAMRTRDLYYPEWGSITPTRMQTLAYNGAASAEDNGAALKAAIAGLIPGDELEIDAGTYSVNSWWDLNVCGTASAPIWIRASSGATVVITRPDNAQNTMNIGIGSRVQYVCLQNLEITGGDTNVKIYQASNLWLDGCEIHGGTGAALTANSDDTDHLYITRNEIYDTGGHGEGMYLGANNSAYIMTHSVVALNHVYDCLGSGTVAQGDGIEVKQGSYDNWVVENHIHNTNYPCLTIYGTDGNTFNLIERNTCYTSVSDNVMQVQGEAVVRNNLCIGGVAAFNSHDHQDSVVNLTVVHNTFINDGGEAAHLSDWDGRAGMTFANNACYSQSGGALNFASGSTGVTVNGNICHGTVLGTPSGYTTVTAGMADFENLAWDASVRDATPSAGSNLLDVATLAHAVYEDLNAAARFVPYDVGAVQRP